MLLGLLSLPLLLLLFPCCYDWSDVALVVVVATGVVAVVLMLPVL